ncbi:hypothetical protein LCGC14_0404620 [marine sediment metagenome]|uniref:Nucleotidyl transferase domain-containing protein n=1 Tax=marine sediment metagenome TaxID=412755 RepID=A0A0F9TDL1_9ZZZZ|nr:MAG: Bifunctional protein GlmU [Candidatus Lokiarchaeum sp. GC14_75]
MKAIILCAGRGTRLKPYTDTYQKAMIPLFGKPLLEYIINGLIFAGFENIILVVGYLKEQVKNYFKNGSKWGIKIEYVTQKKANGTGAAALLCEDLITNNHFFLTWGDILVPYNMYKRIYETYLNNNQHFILLANYTDDPHKGGAIFSKDGYCVDIIEKPAHGKSGSNLNNCGVFIFHREIFEVLRKVKLSNRNEIELTGSIKLGIQDKRWKVRVIKMKKDQFRGDFGNIEVYEQLRKDARWLKKLN